MTDESGETIRTKAITYTRTNWKIVLHIASWGLAGFAAYEFGQGHKQAEKEMNAQDFKNLQTDVASIHSDISQMKESQARTEGTLSAINMWAQGMATFKQNVQGGARDALDHPVPKLTDPKQGHRAKH